MHSTTVLDPMPDVEITEDPLDLTRPELKGLMDRYCSKPDEAQGTIVAPPTALLVTLHPGEEASLRQALGDEAWVVTTCGGPGTGNCPVTEGAPCGLRKSADAAVVFVDANEFSGSLGTIPRLRCAADSSSSGVVVLEGSSEPAHLLGRSATVGALRGTKAILSTVKSLLAANGQLPPPKRGDALHVHHDPQDA